MEKITYDQFINAPREKVWHTMLDDATYRDWTAAFNMGGSYFKGDWNEGSEIHFIGPGEDGTEGGMVGKITESRPFEKVTITFTGMIMNGVVDTTSDMAKAFSGGTESYTFTEQDGGTNVHVELAGQAMPPEVAEELAAAWPKALLRLKEIAEQA